MHLDVLMRGFKLEIARESDKNIKHACISSYILGVYLIVTSKNHNEDAFFPCYLRNISRSHALVLRSNKFLLQIYCLWRIKCQLTNASIVNLALNKFIGQLQIEYFSMTQC